MTTGQRSALMPSTPLAYPQVNRIFESDSIPGSSTKKAAGQSIKVPFAELRQDPAGRYLAAFRRRAASVSCDAHAQNEGPAVTSIGIRTRHE
jgi:hypothetical protein